MPDDPQNDIRVTPGGLVSTVPSHLTGLRGAKAYFQTRSNGIDGFFNLVSLNGQTAVPFLNTAGDQPAAAATLLLGGQTVGAGDTVDVARQNLLSQMFYSQRDVSFVPTLGVFNSEAASIVTGPLNYGAAQEPFTTAGTVTVAAASNIITGAGTTWTVDVLTGAYVANKSLNLIIPGDLIGVNNAGNTATNWFRILAVTDNTHLVVFPTPTAGNASIGAGRAYRIIRTGYGGYSRGIPIEQAGNVYWYYAGSAYNKRAAPQDGHGVVQAITYDSSITNHFMAPQTVTTLGAPTGFFPTADDVAYYKGFLLYGANTAVSWSVAGFPTATPFGATDFPAANITVVDASSKFVTFEYLGDQLLAMFEESIWLISATASVPEFAFYRLPETLGILHPSRPEPCGISFEYVYGRPSCSGRGAVFYASDRGIEQLSGGLSQEITQPIYDVIGQPFPTTQGLVPAFLSWSDDFDLLWARAAWGETGLSWVYNPASQDWSIFRVVPAHSGRSIVAITGGVPAFTRQNDSQRLWHVGYYETLIDGNAFGGINYRVQQNPDYGGILPGVSGPSSWKWRTPIIPLGLRYPDFSFGGFLIDMAAGQVAGFTFAWSLYSGSSPYNMVLRQSDNFAPVLAATVYGTGPFTPWTSSNERLAMKDDLAFVMIELSGAFAFDQIAGIVLFNANTQVKR